LAVAVAGVTAFLLVFFLLTEKTKTAFKAVVANHELEKMFQGWGKIARDRNALLVGFVQASQYYVFGAIEFFIVGYMAEVANLNALFSGTFLSAEVATLIVARPFLGRLSDKRGRRTPILLGSGIGVLLTFAIPFTTQFPLLLLISLGYGLGFAMVISSTSPLMSELAPQGLVGASMGFLSTLMDIGQTLGPLVSGAVLAIFSHSYTALFASFSLLLLVSALVFSLSKRLSSNDKR
jgi:MFS family permease